MKKFLLFLILILLITGCRTHDSVLFKNEFENYNTNKNYVKVSIPSDNPFSYITDSDLVKKIENKEDIIVLFGYSKSNDTRNIISKIIDNCKDLNINKIYYINILEIRDLKEKNEEGNIQTSKEGSSSYLKILELLDDYTSDYVVNNQMVGTRIYAPSILVIKNKNIYFEHIKSYLDNNEDIDIDINNRIQELLKKYNPNTCDVDEGC